MRGMSSKAKAAAADASPVDEPKGRGRRKLLLLAAGPVVLLLGGGLWFSGWLPHLLGHAAKPQVAAVAPPVFVAIPELIANLNAGPQRNSFVKLQARLELAGPADQAAVEAAMPRLQDLFMTYLREMRPEELHGASGTWRLREALIARANIAAAPAHIVDVLFTEMIVQ
jgi:flagellar FliL protein